MHPLLFVNWCSVSARFRALMWVAAIVLASVSLVHLAPVSTAVHHSMRVMR
jgi:hypothetical protein